MPKPVIPETQRRYAICIGINQYDASACMPDLRFAENDACALHKLLLQHGFLPEHSRLLTGTEATLDAIQQALRDIVLTRPGKDDLVVFYFAGHGTLVSLPDEEEHDEPQTDVFLVSHDFSYQHIAQESGLWLEHPLRLENLRTRFFERTRSKKVLFLFDSCHSGDFPGSPYREGETPVAHIKQMFAKSSAGRVALSSCMPQQKAREDAQFQHGLFTHYLLEALAGRAPDAVGHDGWVTVGSLFDYLSTMLPEHQRPVRSGVEHGSFQLLRYEQHARANTASTSQANEDEQRRFSRQQRLQALLADHHGFMDDRLNSFVGRERELVEIRQRIAEKQATGGYVTITGQAGQGKSSIIAKLVDEYGPENVAFHFIPINPGPDHQVGLLRNLMARLILKYDLSELYVQSESRPALRDYFPKVLGELVGKGGKEVIFLDGLDQLEEELTGVRDLSFLPNNPPAGVVFVLGTRPNDTLRPLELLKPRYEYRLPNLSRQDFDLILQHRQVPLSRELANQFYQAMQENALYLDLVAKELGEHGTIPPAEMIAQLADNPENLFSLAMARLKRQPTEWREVIKPVLGLLLAAREPLAKPHMRQILQVEDDRLNDGLERLGGLIADNGQQRYYLYHLKFRDYLHQDEHNPTKKYIFATDEEERWHHSLASWCKQGNLALIWENVPGKPIEQERRVYARHHYITHLFYARAWPQLFEVLDAQVYGQEKIKDDLSTHLYAQDLDLGRQAAAWEGWTLSEGVEKLAHLWRYTLLRTSLASQADQYTPEMFETLVWLRREQYALDLAELLTDLTYRVKILLQTARILRMQPGREQKSLQVYVRVQEVLRLMEDGESKRQALYELGMAFIQARQWDQAEAIANSFAEKDGDVSILRELCKALAHAQLWERAEAIARSFEGSWASLEMFYDLGIALIQFQLWERAEAIANSLAEKDGDVSILRELCKALAQAQQWERAEAIARSFEGSWASLEMFYDLGIALIQSQQWEQAEAVAASLQESETKASLLCGLGVALARAGQWEQAEAISRSLWWEKTSRTKVVYELCRNLLQSQQWERVEEIVTSLWESETSARILSELATALFQAQRLARAKATWEKVLQLSYTIRDKRVRVSILCDLGKALVEAQQWNLAEQVWAEATLAANLIKKEWDKAEVLRELGQVLVQTHQLKLAERVWIEAEIAADAIKDASLNVRAREKLLEALVQAQQWERAEALARSLEDKGDSAAVLRELGIALAQAQQWERAEHVWAEVSARIYSTVGNETVKQKVLFELGKALAQAQQWERAEALARSLEDKGDSSAVVLRELGIALAQAQQWERAEAVILSIGESEIEAMGLLDLGAKLIEVQQLNKAELILKKVNEIIQAIPNTDSRVRLLKHTVKLLSTAKKYDYLLRFVQHCWLQVDTRENAIKLLPLAIGLLPLRPELGTAFVDASNWVESFLEK